ncbi:unnamed protein product [Mytilus edulis]|uniref:Caspase family p20 domain-containing protein n=1 Tax=Mytilus edulis TaxID=6550 RepID=A0A8S3UNH5_MYTED|nr:unnamed protein product [Mytilus edulis]
MSDMEEETLDLASEQGTSTRNTHEMSNADLFSLLKAYMDTRLSGIETSFTDTTHTLEKKVKKAENSLKFKGHQVQYELNVDLQDLSEGRWKTVQEYLSDDLASDSEDEKKIRAADTRAVKKLKSVKSADKKQNVRKRPTEASGSTSQTAHNAIPVSVSMPPFQEQAWLRKPGQKVQGRRYVFQILLTGGSLLRDVGLQKLTDAGIPQNQLGLVTDAEAAFAYCQILLEGDRYSKLEDSTEYMIVDLGENVTSVAGIEVLQKNQSIFLSIERRLEEAKLSSRGTEISVKHCKPIRAELKKLPTRTDAQYGFKVERSYIVFSKQTVTEIFKNRIDAVISEIEMVFKAYREATKISYIVMTGDFYECCLVHKMVESKFTQKHIIFSDSNEEAAMKGAVFVDGSHAALAYHNDAKNPKHPNSVEGIKTTDGSITVEELIIPFKNDKAKSFIGKPKLFLIQSCRGRDEQQLIKNENATEENAVDYSAVLRMPRDADMILIYATTPGNSDTVKRHFNEQITT